MAQPIYIIYFFNDTAPTEIYALSLHDALPISGARVRAVGRAHADRHKRRGRDPAHLPATAFVTIRDRKSTRLNSSHVRISYAVFCLKKKEQQLELSQKG